MDDDKKDQQSKGSSGASCALEIAILILTAITISKDLDKIVDPLKILDPATSENFPKYPQANYIKPKAAFLQKQPLIMQTIPNECSKSDQEIFDKYVGEANRQKIKDALNYNKKMNLITLVISAVTIGSTILFGCVCACCCVACLENMKESGAACCVMIEFLLLVLTSLAFAIVMLICSVLAMKRIKSDVPTIPVACATTVPISNAVNEFNSFRDGFNGRNVAVVVLTSIIMGLFGIFFLCVCCACCCGAIAGSA